MSSRSETPLPNPAGRSWKSGIHRRLRAIRQRKRLRRKPGTALVHVPGLGKSFDMAKLQKQAAKARRRCKRILTYFPESRRRTRRLRDLVDELELAIHLMPTSRTHNIEAICTELRHLVDEAEAADAALVHP